MSVAQIRSHFEDLMDIGEVNPERAVILLLSLQSSQFIEVRPNKLWGLIDTEIKIISPLCKQLIAILKKYHAPLPFKDLKEHLYKTKWYSSLSDKSISLFSII